MMKIFEIHTEENEKEVDLGVHGVSSEDENFDEEDATIEAETEIANDFRSVGYKVEVQRTPEFSFIHAWNGDEDRRITIWASIYSIVELYYRP